MGRKEGRGSEAKGRASEEEDGEEGGREAVRRRMERKGENVVRRTTPLLSNPFQYFSE